MELVLNLAWAVLTLTGLACWLHWRHGGARRAQLGAISMPPKYKDHANDGTSFFSKNDTYLQRARSASLLRGLS